MPTKHDVFAEVIERAPCSAKDLPFRTPVYAHLNTLVDDGLLTKKGTRFTPATTPEAKRAFEIIKYSLKNGLDHNIFFSKNMGAIITELFTHAPDMRPKRLKGNQDTTSIIQFLEKHQFILLVTLRPRKGIILKHELFESILSLHHQSRVLEQAPFIPVEERLIQIQERPVNQFDDEVFAFLSGSAQLEGSTITPGETKELLINDVYPNKPKKDIQMVQNLNEAVHYILEHLNETITPERVMELNRLVLFSLHRHAGKYKLSHNKIQGNPDFKTAKPQEVPHLMNEYCAYLDGMGSREECLREIGRMHNALQRIHPFADGNSRTTRMVMNWMLLKHGLPLLVLKTGCFDTYMGLTKLSKERDDEKLKRLFHQVIYHEHIV